MHASKTSRLHTADVDGDGDGGDGNGCQATADGGDDEHGQRGNGRLATDGGGNAPPGLQGTFAQLLLRPEVAQGLAALGFARPSPIQRRVVPVAKFGLDVIAQAKSGTGKTLVFAITALELLDLQLRAPQVVVLSPTREIAQQTHILITQLGARFADPPLHCELLVGGFSRNEHKQTEASAQHAHILVATPGRLQQMLQLHRVPVDGVRLLVLDEADTLFHGDFIDQTRTVFNLLPPAKQVMALSATWPDDVLAVLRSLLKNPQEILLSHKNPALQGVRQFVRVATDHADDQAAYQVFQWKVDQLCSLLAAVPFHQCLVFLNQRTRAAQLAKLLTQMGWASEHIAGAHEQTQRFSTMASLRQFQLRVLVASDLMARGIDVERINLVVNMDLPADCETYLHRVGRAGRFGTYGIAVALATRAEAERLAEFAQQAAADVTTLGADWAPLLEVPVDRDVADAAEKAALQKHEAQRRQAEAFMTVKPVDIAAAFEPPQKRRATSRPDEAPAHHRQTPVNTPHWQQQSNGIGGLQVPMALFLRPPSWAASRARIPLFLPPDLPF